MVEKALYNGLVGATTALIAGAVCFLYIYLKKKTTNFLDKYNPEWRDELQSKKNSNEDFKPPCNYYGNKKNFREYLSKIQNDEFHDEVSYLNTSLAKEGFSIREYDKRFSKILKKYI